MRGEILHRADQAYVQALLSPSNRPAIAFGRQPIQVGRCFGERTQVSGVDPEDSLWPTH